MRTRMQFDAKRVRASIHQRDVLCMCWSLSCWSGAIGSLIRGVMQIIVLVGAIGIIPSRRWLQVG